MTEGPGTDDPRRILPSVDALLQREEVAPWCERWGREVVRDAVRQTLAQWRSGLRPEVLEASVEDLLANLGRAPLAEEAVRAAATVAGRYSSLEYDVEDGSRGDRYVHCTSLLCRLTGSEDALIVNNNAAAVSLAINELARGREVIVSRGELVEIGGGFRVPEVIERSGGFLKAVGTTNRTRADDYARAVTPSTGLLLKVHPSNYRVQGFVEETSIEVLVGLGSRAGVPVMHDLGSGFLLRDGLAAPADEPRPQDSVAAGIDLVTWSGDKLLGGPQAGLLHGQREMIDRLRSNPLLRAFRVDKMTLAALEATLRLHLQPERALERIPALRMLSETATHVERRARLALEVLEAEARPHVTVRPVLSLVGGGTSPGVKLDSAGWIVTGSASRLDALLRASDPPLVGRIEDDALVIDFRTVLPGEEVQVAAVVSRALAAPVHDA